ncbi:MAG: hypothetical protein ACE5PV_20410 [Candidatus Poribacteria bacterium]
MSTTKENKTTQKPRMLALHCALREWMDLADELDKQLAQLKDSKKVRNLFHRLLHRIKIDVQEGDAMIPEKDGSYRPFRAVKPVSLGTLLSLRSVARLHEERKNWTREMLVEEWNRSMERARSQAIADGRAIEHEWKAAIDD